MQCFIYFFKQNQRLQLLLNTISLYNELDLRNVQYKLIRPDRDTLTLLKSFNLLRYARGHKNII